ncbi:hypothetical protein DNU06_02970 [Putridiphycobacter roseus]|uniref:Secretion system C-terminal sorting domain-containing protein n=1 Tax=Putridiphycobacter roseus TaxID=2219161 RepID=A0A2W1NVJ0_9FLAO|nr:T9SS type A sorting domain-containing protein [Putridiphycobacter roseus]PZE18808.1 hypothetical protein DNU06_02970 [Putridiphycobacter roseus]
MKKALQFLAACLISMNVNAQKIEIYKADQTTDVSGTTLYASSSADEMHLYLDIKNVSNSALSLTITRKRINEVPGSKDYFCWGFDLLSGQCYSADDVSSSNPWTATNQYSFSAGGTGILYAYHVTEGNQGSAKYRYYVVEDGVHLDSVDVIFNYFLGLEKEDPASFSVYPNPVNDQLNINADNLGNNSSITVYDITGKTVATATLQNGKNVLNLKDLNAGVYFYAISNDLAVIETKKLIVQ